MTTRWRARCIGLISNVVEFNIARGCRVAKDHSIVSHVKRVCNIKHHLSSNHKRTSHAHEKSGCVWCQSGDCESHSGLVTLGMGMGMENWDVEFGLNFA